MTVTNGYVAGDRLAKASGVKTGEYDAAIDNAINAASRAIDAFCGRYFYADTEASARVFHPDDYRFCRIDDVQRAYITSVKSDTSANASYSTTWATTDYQLEPLNAVVGGLTGWPGTGLRAVGSYRFLCPYNRIPSVQVTARWGWAAVPAAVTNACLTLAQAHLGGEDSGAGTSGYGEFEGIRVPWDKMRMVKAELGPFVRVGGTGLAFA